MQGRRGYENCASAADEVGVLALEEGRQAAAPVFGVGGLGHGLGLGGELGFEAGVEALGHEPFGGPHRLCGAGRELAGEFVDAVVEVGGGHDLGGEAEVDGPDKGTLNYAYGTEATITGFPVDGTTLSEQDASDPSGILYSSGCVRGAAAKGDGGTGQWSAGTTFAFKLNSGAGDIEVGDRVELLVVHEPSASVLVEHSVAVTE